MMWTAIKAAALNTLMKWVARNLWLLAQDMVNLVAHRDDLEGEQKFALAKAMLVDKLKEMGTEFSTSGVNWVLENAVQYWKHKAKM